ncbi:NusG domain II-containing protein [Sporomusa acidovorans]|uniref:NusG domain II-containing protein n=1 Tax=Sporomusa acidovorans TaxID=112900 RepID=UPI0008901D7A|nr:NusG domain II-containing protein [Sporomusa acidovorans]OZC19057.1 hypothetical protein SPACI_31430 [Sporomusa acidovorans DSM 3132]SDD65985.1 hypothetical protein SAMN04488499_10033 [Sporomusa acidovorans]
MVGMTRADKVLVVLVLLIAIVGIGLNMSIVAAGGEQKAEIWVEGTLYKTVPLKEGYKQEIRIGGDSHYDIIEVQHTRIRVREADCPNQDCIKMGWIQHAPQQIVCLPYRIVIKIVSSAPVDTDTIVR